MLGDISYTFFELLFLFLLQGFNNNNNNNNNSLIFDYITLYN